MWRFASLSSQCPCLDTAKQIQQKSHVYTESDEPVDMFTPLL